MKDKVIFKDWATSLKLVHVALFNKTRDEGRSVSRNFTKLLVSLLRLLMLLKRVE